MPKMDTIIRGIYRAGNRVVCVIGSAVFLFLSWHSFRYTQYMNVHSPEIPVNAADSKAQNIMVLVLFMLLFLALAELEGKLSPKTRKLVKGISLFVMLLWVGGVSIWWVCSAERILGSDPLMICNTAASFSRGDYGCLDLGQYCDKYPYQLGLIAVMELVFLVAGTDNFFAYEVVCAVMAPCIAYIGYRIVGEITDSMAAGVCYCLTMLGCLPLMFYTSWVYGEVPGIFFSMLAVLLLLRYSNKKRWGYLAGAVLSLAMAVLVRSNSAVLVIALCIAAFLQAARQRDKRLFAAAFCAIIVPCLAHGGVGQMYEWRSGKEVSEGLPFTAAVSLGLQEVGDRFGWDYATYDGRIYWEVDSDKERAGEIYRRDIEERLEIFKEQPSYAVHFFVEKQLSQWNAPLYQAYYFNHNYKEWPEEGSFLYRLATEYFVWMLRICDRLQFILYMGMLFYFLFGVNKDSNMLHHVLPIMIIGGFFFSLLWEAKTRYVLLYYVGMFPMAALGYRQLMLRAKTLLAFWRR